MARLRGKTALVTGGGSGIGEGVAAAFAREGACVVVTDLDGAAAARVAAAIVAEGGRAVGLAQDVTREQDWDVAIERALGEFGGLSVLVNNAGIAPSADPIETLSLADWRRTMAVNLDGVFLGTRAGIRAMKAGAAGSIINISSVYGLVGTTRAPDYVAAKGAVRLFSKAAALECAEAGYRIRVNSLHPGFIDTPMLERGLAEMSRKGIVPDPATGKAAITGMHPIGRLGTPTDVAAAAIYLASEESAFMTGAELVVDGGYTAR
ncbi:MAG: glucose 1-dehydrogenase [Steroidobacteraceae bacterium]